MKQNAISILPASVSDVLEQFKSLRQHYTGIWGSKVLWLALFTLLPLAIRFKSEVLGLTLSPATVVYAIYHAFGLRVWYIVNQIERHRDLFAAAEASKLLTRATTLHKRLVHPLSYLVITLLSVTFLLKVRFEFPGFGRPTPISERILRVLAPTLGIDRPSEPEPVPIDFVCRAEEQRRIQQPVPPNAPKQFASPWDLLPFYIESNASLFAHLQNIPPNGGQKEIIIVTGGAGSGKSYLKDSLLTTQHPVICDLRKDGYDRLWRNDVTPDAPDLVMDGRPLSTRPKLRDSRIFDLFALCASLGQTDPSVIILDSLDEIHSSDQTGILEKLEDQVFTSSGSLCVCIVLGRPESFHEYYNLPQKNLKRRANVHLFPLNGPRFFSFQDFDRVCNNYEHWQAPARIEAAKRSGLFEFCQARLFARLTIEHLGFKNYLLEVLNSNTSQSEYSVKTGVFDLIMSRNGTTHGRPNPHADAKDYELYRLALYAIAAKYHEVDKEGYFEVLNNDVCEFCARDKSTALVRPAQILNYSGLVELDPLYAAGLRYRFAPLWIHSYLIEAQNMRTIERHMFRTCDPTPPERTFGSR